MIVSNNNLIINRNNNNRDIKKEALTKKRIIRQGDRIELII